MQNPRLERRAQSLATHLFAYVASSLIAGLFLVQTASLLGFLPERIGLNIDMFHLLLGHSLVLALFIGMIAALPMAAAIWILRRRGMDAVSWPLFSIAGTSFGFASALVCLELRDVLNRLSNWLTVVKPNDSALSDPLIVASMVAIFSGGAAGLTYWIIAHPRANPSSGGLKPS